MVGIPIVSTFRFLMYDQNRFAECEQIDAMYLHWVFLVSLCAILRTLPN